MKLAYSLRCLGIALSVRGVTNKGCDEAAQQSRCCDELAPARVENKCRALEHEPRQHQPRKCWRRNRCGHSRENLTMARRRVTRSLCRVKHENEAVKCADTRWTHDRDPG